MAIESERLIIRPFNIDDLDAIHQLLDIDLSEAEFGLDEGAYTLADRKRWLQWTILNYGELARLYQTPYGDRAIVLKQTGLLIGACGLTACLCPFDQLPAFRLAPNSPSTGLYTNEMGLFYAISPDYQLKGYATEAAQALIHYTFTQLHLKRIVATTTRDNVGSMSVMRKLGMSVEHNPLPDPPWFQVIGFIENRHP